MSVAKAAKARSRAQWPSEAFHYIFNLAEFPTETLLETACCPPPNTHTAASAMSCLSWCRQVNFHISIWIESGVTCYVNDSTVVSICVALAGLERQLLNKHVSGNGERKDHIAQSARWKKYREG